MKTMQNTAPIKLLELEIKASKSDLSREDFQTVLWQVLVVSKNRKQVNQFAKDLNIFPNPVNVYNAIVHHFFNHIN